jgi:signal transduction histidine kinase
MTEAIPSSGVDDAGGIDEATCTAGVLAQLDEGIGGYRRDGTCVFQNDANLRLLGRTRDELLGENIWRVFPDAVGSPFHVAFQRAAETAARQRFDHDYAPWGRAFENHIFVLNDVVWTVSREVTEQVRGRERAAFLAEASAILSSSLDYQTTLRNIAALSVPSLADWCSIEMIGPDGRLEQLAIVHVDPEKVALAKELRRLNPPDAVKRTGSYAVIDSGKSRLIQPITDEMLEQSVVDPRTLRIARMLRLSSSLSVPIAWAGRVLGVLNLVQAESGRRYAEGDVALAEEVAARAALAVDNARLYDQAQRAIRLRDDFLSIASHELRTPLGTLQLLLGTLPDGPQAAALESRKVRMLKRQLARMTTLVDQLLDVARIAAGRLPIERRSVDLAAVVRDVVASFEEDARRPGTELLLSAPEPVIGSWDADRLDQAVTNLVSNALKYGSGTQVDVVVERTADGGRVTVSDRGVGIPAAEQERIFERFERASTAGHRSGLGLGLWITKQIVDSHGGRIAVRSQPNQGASFVVDLPLS